MKWGASLFGMTEGKLAGHREIIIVNDDLHRTQLKDQNKGRFPSITSGAFFWDYSGYCYSGLGITEYTDFQLRKERCF